MVFPSPHPFPPQETLEPKESYLFPLRIRPRRRRLFLFPTGDNLVGRGWDVENPGPKVGKEIFQFAIRFHFSNFNEI